MGLGGAEQTPWTSQGRLALARENPLGPPCRFGSGFREDDDTFIGEYFDVDRLDTLMADKFINGVGRAGMLASAGLGKETTDFRSACGQGHVASSGSPNKSGVKQVAANGDILDNYSWRMQDKDLRIVNFVCRASGRRTSTF